MTAEKSFPLPYLRLINGNARKEEVDRFWRMILRFSDRHLPDSTSTVSTEGSRNIKPLVILYFNVYVIVLIFDDFARRGSCRTSAVESHNICVSALRWFLGAELCGNAPDKPRSIL